MHTTTAETMTPPMKQLMQISTSAQTGSDLGAVGAEFELRTQIVPLWVPKMTCKGKEVRCDGAWRRGDCASHAWDDFITAGVSENSILLSEVPTGPSEMERNVRKSTGFQFKRASAA